MTHKKRVTNQRTAPTKRRASASYDANPVMSSSGSKKRAAGGASGMPIQGDVSKKSQKVSQAYANPKAKHPSRRKNSVPLSNTHTKAGKTSQKTSARSKKNALKAPGFPLATFWRNAQKASKKKKRSGLVGFFSTIGAFLISLIKALGANFWYLIRVSHVAQLVLAGVVLIGAFGVFDLVTTSGKAYTGVRVGTVDVGGKTAGEIEELLREAYGSQVANGSAIIFASEEAKATVDADMAQAQDAAVAQQVALDEFRANKQAWRVTSEDVGAYVPVEELAKKALAVGREDGGSIARLQALTQGYEVAPDVAFNETFVENLAQDLDNTLGVPRNDYGVEVSNGWAYTIAGNDGEMVDRKTLTESLVQAFLGNEQSFVAHVEPAPLHITEQQAQEVANLINERIAYGCTFTYDGYSWMATPYDLGTWISVAAIPDAEGNWSLRAFIDAEKAKPSLLAHLEEVSHQQPGAISFSVTGDSVVVNTKEAVAIPMVSKTVTDLQTVLFGKTFESSTPTISVEKGQAPGSMNLSEALNLGIVSTISSFKTEFTTGEGTENRNHNIALASELLNNSVIAPDATWSFNGTSGDCNAEAGFQEAGAIVAGEYVDAIGGGICQVATTVFNAVYEAGFPVVSRWNHSLYIASYPAGRDAAVSYPDLDLRWQNDTKSDVLLQVKCGEGSVTATLYGVDPGYVVTSETGAWEKGDTYRTIEKQDDSLAKGNYYTQTVGADGSKIQVTRTVTDQDGNLIRQDVFDSVYDPKDEVIIRGPDTEVPHHEDETTSGEGTQDWNSYNTNYGYTDTIGNESVDNAVVADTANTGTVDTTYPSTTETGAGDGVFTDSYDETGQL